MADDHEGCKEALRAMYRRHNIEVIVSSAPPLVKTPATAMPFTWPRGVNFSPEPTGEQIAAWARAGAA